MGLAKGTPLLVAVFAGLILGTGVYTMGKISGAHFNPVVSIALATVNKLKWSDAVLYVVFQFIGAALAPVVGGTVAAWVYRYLAD